MCAYADDVVIVARSETRLRQVYRELEEKTQQMGLIVNEINDYVGNSEGK
jgi:short-subunit dehydrogenase